MECSRRTQPLRCVVTIFIENKLGIRNGPDSLADFKKRNILIFLPSIKKNFLNNKYPCSSVQIWRNKYFFLFYQAKINSLNILSLLCRIEEINIFIIPPSRKNPWIYILRIEETNVFIILPSIKKPFKTF